MNFPWFIVIAPQPIACNRIYSVVHSTSLDQCMTSYSHNDNIVQKSCTALKILCSDCAPSQPPGCWQALILYISPLCLFQNVSRLNCMVCRLLLPTNTHTVFLCHHVFSWLGNSVLMSHVCYSLLPYRRISWLLLSSDDCE